MLTNITTIQEYWDWLKRQDTFGYAELVAGKASKEIPVEHVAFPRDFLEVVENRKAMFQHMIGDWSAGIEVETGCYERIYQIQPGDVVLDLGAHIGYFTKIASEKVGPQGHVVAVEPWSRNVEKILAACPSPSYDNVFVLQMASWNASRKILPFYPRQSSSEGSVYHRPEVDHEDLIRPAPTDVETIALDDLVGLFGAYGQTGRLDFIKIDIEGAEVETLRGAKRLLDRFRPKMVLELHGTAKPVRALLDELGYMVEAACLKLTAPLETDRQVLDAWTDDGLWYVS